MNKPFLLLFLTIACLSTQAQRWHESFYNAPRSLYYNSHNPTRISHNNIRQHAVAHVDYQHGEGDFHPYTAGQKQSQVTAYIGGLRQVGKFDLQGHMCYQNSTEHSQRWNSTLWNNPYNPFTLADSIAGDATTEAFDLHTTASYAVASRWRVGAEAGLRTGNRSDQNDPRPRAVTAVIPLALGVEYMATSRWTVGLSGGLRLFNSTIEYYNARGENNHVYFLMKGMGDYARRSSGDEPGYKRDYVGNTYTASLQASYLPQQGHWHNFAEARLWNTYEDATDGGTAYTFRGGDYHETGIAFQERLQWGAHLRTQHTLQLAAHYITAHGVWYAQRRELDVARGGAILYHTLNKSTLQRQQRFMAGLHYRRDGYRNSQRHYFVGADLGLEHLQYEQLLGTSTPTQRIQHLHFGLQGGRAFTYRRVALWAELGGSYHYPLTRTYASGSTYVGSNDIAASYTRPTYAYAASGRAVGYGLIDVQLPLSKGLQLGFYLRAQTEQATNNAPEAYRTTTPHYTTIHLGVYLHF